MRTLQTKNWYRKIVAGVAAAAASALFLAGGALAQEFDKIKIYPEHVGVFTDQANDQGNPVGSQQFVAFGLKAGQDPVNITTLVGWKSSNTNIVTIDANGLATIVQGVTSGQVSISCTYPKSGGAMTGVNQLLLSGEAVPVPTYTVTVNATNGPPSGEGTVVSVPGGISYSYPTDNSGTSSSISEGTSVVVTAVETKGGTVSFGTSCTDAGGVEDAPAGDTATCTFSSLDGDKTITVTFTTT